MKLLPVLALAFCLPSALAATPTVSETLPASLELHYRFRYNGLTVGHVTKTLVREADGRYRHRSHSRPEGMARVFTTVEWYEEGRFEIVNGEVRPLEFLEYRVGADKPHRHSATFDWKSLKILYSHGGSVPLLPGTQDQGSLIFAWMQKLPEKDKPQTLHLSGGKKLKSYRYSQVGTETLRTALGKLQTIIIERPGVTGEKDAETLRVWLAPDRGNLPVRIATVKRGEDTILEIESVIPPGTPDPAP